MIVWLATMVVWAYGQLVVCAGHGPDASLVLAGSNDPERLGSASQAGLIEAAGFGVFEDIHEVDRAIGQVFEDEALVCSGGAFGCGGLGVLTLGGSGCEHGSDLADPPGPSGISSPGVMGL
jgi:hypothetical protein